MTYVSFPGLFEKVLEINPVAFSVFGLSVYWYGLIICTGIILAVLNTVRCAHREGLSTDDVLDYALWTVPLAIVGARLYYVITSDSSYDTIREIIAIWNGGLAIYGAVIAGAVTVFIVSLVKKIRFTKIGDAAAVSLLIGQAIGRWGNFCNGEAYGHLDRLELLGKTVQTPGFQDNYLLRMSVSSNATGGALLTVHPTFLYESVWNLLGFIVLSLIYKKKKFDGQIILCYLAWYGLGRFFIEGLRADSLMLGNTNIRISQLLALLTFVFALIAMAVMLIRGKKADDGEYQSQFAFAGEGTDDRESTDASGAEANEVEADTDNIQTNNGGQTNGSDN